MPTAAGLRNPSSLAKHWAMVEKYRPTVIGGIPNFPCRPARRCPQRRRHRQREILRDGGAPLPPDVANEFSKTLWAPGLQIYGMTDAPA